MDIDAVRERVDLIENKMCDFTAAHNELVDSHFELEEVEQLRMKVAYRGQVQTKYSKI